MWGPSSRLVVFISGTTLPVGRRKSKPRLQPWEGYIPGVQLPRGIIMFVDSAASTPKTDGRIVYFVFRIQK
jgi:hypothetical protein